MDKVWKSILRNPTFWSGALAGVLIAVLVLAAVNVYAQTGGDVRPEGTGPTPAPNAGTGSGNPPDAAPDGSSSDDSQLAPAESGEMMFSPPDAAPFAATAAISSTITYQGVLKNDGQPANGNFDLRFRLFDDVAAGAQLAEQVVSAVTVQAGQFTAPLDFGPDAFSAQALWLEIAVRPAGGGAYETLAPRQALTAAPLALGLPNVTTDPTTGRVSIGGGSPISGFEMLGINREINDWIGMYITGGGPNARPFYGYATDDEGTYEFAWTEYNGTANEWQLYTASGNVFAVSNAGDVRGSGNFSQPADADGLVKAAAYVECWDDTFVTVYRSFNTVTGAPVTAAAGPAQGECYVDFGFDLTSRFFNATGVFAGAPRGVTCDVDGGNNNRLRCMRWRPTDAGAEGWGGTIMVTVY